MNTAEHKHIYNENGEQICCSLEEKIEKETSDHNKDEGHDHGTSSRSEWKEYLPAIISFLILIIGLMIEYLLKLDFFKDPIKLIWYIIAYIPVGIPVIKEALQALRKGEVFTEFFLMSVATIGAFAIGEYPEGVAVMLFYAVGELFQSAAVRKAKSNITALLDLRPKTANVLRQGSFTSVPAESVAIGDTVQVRVGESVPLDGRLSSEKASLNTAALTGESRPSNADNGDDILAGSINLEGVIEVEVTKEFNDSSVSRILELVEHARDKKSKTELLIRRLAKIYTPIVVYLSLAIVLLPYFFVESYLFNNWLYRGLIFLVISCPCALVISIPLGYFGGLGAASKHGLLFKGASFLDEIIDIDTVVMDKTGTVTKGVFEIKDIVMSKDQSEKDMMSAMLTMEAGSTHPIAKAIMRYTGEADKTDVDDLSEIAGKGLRGTIHGKEVVVGNKKLMEQFDIQVPSETDAIVESIVMIGIGGEFAGYVTIADELKEDAEKAIADLRAVGIKRLIMLSGDKDSITQQTAALIDIDIAKGGLLPEDKLNEVEELKKSGKVAFAGDGINDAPVIAASDVGIAMGALGSDVAIETADVIIQTDKISRIATGIKIGRSTKKVIVQNIYMAFGIKILVLAFGAFGMATMWEAVFADVGVALLAILNATRLQRMGWT
ncbi:MAG: cadmium-translocating P-type ATPase [Flavobacteriales bacterium]|nr:cadmium-translocating P-type ATPase [Flavobacteriales bacterium]